MALWIAREIKRMSPKSIILLGGPQPSSAARRIIEEFDCVDFVVCGEGETPLEQMIELKFDRKKLLKVSGIVARDGSTIIENARAKLTDNMDDLPFPDYSLVRLSEYTQNYKGGFIPNVEVGRGCPFHCTFCSTSIMWERKFRVKSPQRIFAEMSWLHQNYGFTLFDFVHDNFTTSRKFVLELCDYLIKNNHLHFLWGCSSRTDCIDIPRLEYMQKAGLLGLFFGLETGSTRMQKVIKKDLDFEHFEPILKRAKEIGIICTTSFILGFPEETLADINETVGRAIKYKLFGAARVFISKLSPLVGTEVYQTTSQQLTEVSYSSNISPQDYGLPYIRNLIAKYPDLFSSFYHVPHPIYSLERMAKFLEFVRLLMDSELNYIHQRIEKEGLAVTELFDQWELWAEEKSIYYYDYRHFSSRKFKLLFSQFLNEKPNDIRQNGPSYAVVSV